MVEPWVSAEAVQQHLGISQDTLYRLIADRGLPATKIGGRWRFKLSMVDAWAMNPDNDETKRETKDHG
jgi:excisionase family DNA binding protein